MILNPVSIAAGAAFVIHNLGLHDVVLDLSQTNGVNITAWAPNGGKNQQWMLNQVGSGSDLYTIQNVADNTKYIGYDGEPSLGQNVIGQDSPINWAVSHVAELNGHKLTVPGKDLVLDLKNRNSGASGNPIVLKRDNASPSQVWDAKEVP